MANIHENSVFFVDINKVEPNPYQPRREFDEEKLKNLAESIRQYGVLQPLVVSRTEITRLDGIDVRYELIAGERRLRASKLAGLLQVPVIIRVGDDHKAKLELAIIENLQREDLNAIERAQAFAQLVKEFSLTHAEVGERVGKSREYVSNTIRLLSLPEVIQRAIINKELSEGHSRPLLMLNHKPEEQAALFQSILTKRVSVRAAERNARLQAPERARKQEPLPELLELQERLKDALGTRVKVEPKKEGGSAVTIEFFSSDDLKNFLNLINRRETESDDGPIENFTV
jgi:ParB family chromosome partitioning protein